MQGQTKPMRSADPELLRIVRAWERRADRVPPLALNAQEATRRASHVGPRTPNSRTARRFLRGRHGGSSVPRSHWWVIPGRMATDWPPDGAMLPLSLPPLYPYLRHRLPYNLPSEHLPAGSPSGLQATVTDSATAAARWRATRQSTRWTSTDHGRSPRSGPATTEWLSPLVISGDVCLRKTDSWPGMFGGRPVASTDRELRGCDSSIRAWRIQADPAYPSCAVAALNGHRSGGRCHR
jgi:hypothetical protein